MNKFTVFYDDGTNFSGDPFKSEWNNINVTKQIIKLEYVLGNSCVILEGYKQYNHLLEYVGLGQKGITRILLMGRTNDNTEIIVIDLKQNKIYKDFKPIYQEYGKQILNGWQKGMLMIPKSTMKKIKG